MDEAPAPANLSISDTVELASQLKSRRQSKQRQSKKNISKKPLQVARALSKDTCEEESEEDSEDDSTQEVIDVQKQIRKKLEYLKGLPKNSRYARGQILICKKVLQLIDADRYSYVGFSCFSCPIVLFPPSDGDSHFPYQGTRGRSVDQLLGAAEHQIKLIAWRLGMPALSGAHASKEPHPGSIQGC